MFAWTLPFKLFPNQSIYPSIFDKWEEEAIVTFCKVGYVTIPRDLYVPESIRLWVLPESNKAFANLPLIKTPHDTQAFLNDSAAESSMKQELCRMIAIRV